jgi:hypothetical protein
MATRGARADASRSVRIDYDAATGCPDEATFEAALRTRSAKIRVSPSATTAVRVRITPGRSAGQFEGEVSLTESRGHEGQRHVSGVCSDVTAALALIAAVELDPTATTESQPAGLAGPPSSAAPAPSAVAAVPSASSNTPAASASPAPEPTSKAAPARPPAVVEDDASPAADRRRGGPRLPHTWAWSVGAGAALTGGVTPQPLFTVPFFLDVARRTGAPFAPAARLRFERSDSATVLAGGAAANFRFTAGSLDLCPIAWAPWRLRFWPCARIEGGVVEAGGSNETPTRSDTRPWLSAGVALRGRLVFEPVFVELEGSAFAPLIRDRFYVEPDTTLERAPVLAAAGQAGAGVSFW